MEDAAALLRENGIEPHTEEGVAVLDSNIIGVQYESPFRIKLYPEDFEKADKILLDNTHINLAEVPADYMLHSFSNEELMDVVAKREEWGDYNYKVALLLLSQRGVDMAHTTVEEMQQQHFAQLATSKKYDKAWLFLAYFSSFFGIFAGPYGLYVSDLFIDMVFWPSLVGLIVGYGLLTHKTTLPNGERIYTYDKASRKHGVPLIILFVINVLVTLWVLLV